MSRLPLGRVTFVGAPSRPSVVVEIAADPASQARGLMGRRSLPLNRGMLFIWPADALQTIWMRDTRVPLDAIFVDSRGIITGIARHMSALSDVRWQGAGRYVVEVNGGFSEHYGLYPGQRVLIELS